MWLEGWHIEGFGQFAGQTTRGLPGGLVIVSGPNEAGKSTLLHFIQFILFGRGKGARRAELAEALAGGRLGGRLFFRDEAGETIVERLDSQVQLIEPGKRTTDADALVRWLGGMDAASFRAVFAVRHEDLARLSGPDDDDVRKQLMAGGVSGAGRDVGKAQQKLGAAKDKLWRPRAQCAIRAELDQIRDRERQLVALRETAIDALRGAASRAEHARVLRQIRLDIDHHATQIHGLRGLMQALEPDQELRSLEAELADLGPSSALPNALGPDLDAFETEQRALDARRETSAEQIADLERRVAVPVADELVLARAHAISELAERCGTLHGSQLADLDATLLGATRRYEEFALEYGLTSSEAITRIPLQGVNLTRLREAANAAASAASQRERASDAQRRHKAARTALAEAEAARDQVELDRPALDRAGEVEALQREAPGARLRLQRLRALDERSKALEQRLAQMAQAAGTTGEELGAFQFDEQERRRIEQLAIDAVGARARVDRLVPDLDRARTRVAHLQAGRPTTAVAGPAPAVLDAIEADGDRACAAFAEAETHRREVASRQIDLDATGGSSAPWTEARQQAASAALAARGQLEASSRDHDSLTRRLADHRERLASLPVPAPLQDPPVTLPEAEVQALAQAEALIHASNERRAREGAPADGLPAWIWGVLLVLALATAAIGATTAARGNSGGAVPWGAVAMILFALGLLVRRELARVGVDARAEAPETDRSQLAAALALAGLAPDAGLAQLASRRATLETRRVEATAHAQGLKDRQRLVGDRTRIEAQVKDLEAQHAEHERAWTSQCAALGLPPFAPRDLPLELARLESARGIHRALQAAVGAGTAAQARWDDWAARARPLAAALDVAPPMTIADARRLLDAIRTHRTFLRELGAATDSLTSITADHEDAIKVAADRNRELETARATSGLPPHAAGREARWFTLVDDARGVLRDLATYRVEARDLEAQRSDLELRITAVRVALGITDDAGDPLEAAARRCGEARRTELRWTSLDQEVTVRARAAAEGARAIEAAELECAHADDALATWQRLRSEHGVPDAIVGPPDLDVFIQRLGAARTALDERRQLQSKRDDLAARLAQATAQAATLGLELGMPAGTAIEIARHLEAALQAARVRARARQDAMDALGTAQRASEEIRVLTVETRRRGESLLTAAGAATVAEAQELITRQRKRLDLTARADELRRTRRIALGGDEAPARIELLRSQAPATWVGEIDRLTVDREDLERRRDNLIRQQQAIDTTLDQARDSATQAELEADLAAAQTRLTQHRRALASLVLANELLRASLETFRAQHQPAVLRRASELMAVASDGTYAALELDDDDELVLVDSAGGRRHTDRLSSGTRDLLYIVLRLSLAEDLSRNYARAPIVLDDLLVNLDAERADQLARIIAALATRQQVLVMTCRAETVALLQRHAVAARVIELPRYAGRGTPVASVIRIKEAREDTLRPATERVHAVLQTSAEWLRKDDLVQRAEIGDDDWMMALKDLKQLGVIETRGKGRGSEYLLKRDRGPVTTALGAPVDSAHAGLTE